MPLTSALSVGVQLTAEPCFTTTSTPAGAGVGCVHPTSIPVVPTAVKVRSVGCAAGLAATNVWAPPAVVLPVLLPLANVRSSVVTAWTASALHNVAPVAMSAVIKM